MSLTSTKSRLGNRKSSMRWRRFIGVTLASIATGALLLLMKFQQDCLINPAWISGYVLIGCLFFLAAFNIRKKLPFLPGIGSSRMWMQIHIYVALASIVIFFAHAGFSIPNGTLEIILAILYLVVAGSGVYGLYITRTIPRKLTGVQTELIWEQIPSQRKRIVQEVRQLILESASQSDVLAKHYTNHLVHFFEKPRSWFYQLSPSLRRSRFLIAEIKGLDRYLSQPQRETSRRLANLVTAKEDLDYHWALQGKLKIWLFGHVGFTYGLLLVAVLHGFMAHAFSGGLR